MTERLADVNATGLEDLPGVYAYFLFLYILCWVDYMVISRVKNTYLQAASIWKTTNIGIDIPKDKQQTR